MMAFTTPATASAAFVLFALIATAFPAAHGLGCVDENGNPVDWYAAIKYSDGPLYAYADANNEEFSKSSNTLQSGGGAITNSLNAAFKEGNSWALYNDEPVGASSKSEDGHTKGVIAVDDSLTGFWLIHSVPNWPATTGNQYSGFPDSETRYGQSFLCISMQGATFDTIAERVYMLSRPQFYDSSFSSIVEAKLPFLVDVATQGTHWLPAASNITTIQSTGGKNFILFAKNGKWGMDLYASLVSPYFSSDVITETWQNGVGQLQDFCPPNFPYYTRNIESFTVAGYTMGETKDHSKWAIPTSHDIWCVGGINRQQHQEERGGGTACFETSSIVSQLKQNVQLWDSPPRGGCASR